MDSFNVSAGGSRRATRGFGDALTGVLFGVLVIGGWFLGCAGPEGFEAADVPEDLEGQRGLLGTNQVARDRIALYVVGMARAPDEWFEPEEGANWVCQLQGKKSVEVAVFQQGSGAVLVIEREGGPLWGLATEVRSVAGEWEAYFVLLPETSAEWQSELDRVRSRLETAYSKAKRMQRTYYIAGCELYTPIVASRGAASRIEEFVTTNPVLAHLVDRALAVDPDFSLAAPIYSVTFSRPPQTKYAEARYVPRYSVVQRAFSRKIDLEDVLGHELTHAGLKFTLVPPPVQSELKDEHPKAWFSLKRLYSEDELLAEELLAFLVGALANAEEHVRFHVRDIPFGENYTVVEIGERLSVADVETLVSLGLVPDWMGPASLGYQAEHITGRYYDSVRRQAAETSVPY